MYLVYLLLVICIGLKVVPGTVYRHYDYNNYPYANPSGYRENQYAIPSRYKDNRYVIPNGYKDNQYDQYDYDQYQDQYPSSESSNRNVQNVNNNQVEEPLISSPSHNFDLPEECVRCMCEVSLYKTFYSMYNDVRKL